MFGKTLVMLFFGFSLLLSAGCDGTKDREEKYLNKAKAYFDEGNYEKMRVDLKNVLQINPKNIEARYLTALLAERNQEWRKMFGNLAAVIEEKPDHYEAQLKLGMLYLFSKDIVKASQKVELVLAVEPDNPDALALKATIHLSKKEIAEAKALLNKALQVEPGHYDASLLSIKMLGAEKNMTEASRVLEASLAAHPDKLKLSLVKINLLMAEDRKDEIEPVYLSLLQRFPENETLYYNFAKFYVLEKKIDEAEQVLKNLVVQLPDKDQPKFVWIDFLKRERGVEQAKKALETLIVENPDNFGFRFAELSIYQGQPEKIQLLLEKIIDDDKLGPAGIEARNKLAQLVNSQGHQDQARKLVDEVIELDSKNVQSLLFRAGLSIKEGDADSALADARTVLRDNPQSEKALMIQAAAQLKLKTAELAEETLEKIVALYPKNLIAIKDLARLKVRNKDDIKAIELLESARVMFKDDLDIPVMLIDLYGKSQKWDKAEEIAKALLENSETKELPHYKLAQLYLGQKKYKQAIVEFRSVLATKPAALDALAGLVNSYLALKQEKEAEIILDKTIAENKDNPALLTMRAELHRSLKQFDDAERLFKRVVELKPKVELGYKNLTTVYLIQKQLDKAIAVYQQGLQEIPESGVFLMQLAILNTVVGETEKAIEAYEILLLKFPKNLLAVNNLSALLVESSDQEDIEKAYVLSDQLKDSTYPAFQDTYGWVSFKNGKIDDALTVLESVMRSEKVVPEMHYHMAMVYISKERNEEAKLELEKAIENDSKFNGLEEAKAALEKLNSM
jgi:tetratricopeptide (TPR) repeat protein